MFAKLQQEQILRLKIEVFSLDSTSVKVQRPNGTGALNMIPVVPPKSNRREPWHYDREYKKRNQVAYFDG